MWRTTPLDTGGSGWREFPPVTVPEGRLWVMGDHRSDSGDSRYHDPSRDGSTGSVPIDDVVGRAVAVVWPFSEMTWLGQPTSVYSAVPDSP